MKIVSARITDRLAKATERPPRHAAPLEMLVVDDDEATRLALCFALADAGHRVSVACDGQEALDRLAEHTFDVAILDIRLPRVDGLEVFRRLRQSSPSTSVILMTAFATIPDAVASLREGAYDYVTKPFDPEELTLRVIGHIAEHRALRHELEDARKAIASRDAGSPLVGATPTMARLLERIDTVAQSDAPVLIRGESGTGKTLVARTLHARSPRKKGPFVALSCAALPESIVDTELFGRRAPGTSDAPTGRLAAADGGTLLLTEIEDLPLAAQAKLLRVLEQGVLEPAESREVVRVDVRLVTTTDRDLRELVARGLFRRDLHLRIAVLDLEMPPLRERKADMPLLVAHFLRRFYPGRVAPSITPRAWSAMTEYPWPGNVRELAHAIERAVALAHGSAIDLEHLPPDIIRAPDAEPQALRPLREAMEEFEKHHLERALELASGREGDAAKLLGVTRKTLEERMRHHGLGRAAE